MSPATSPCATIPAHRPRPRIHNERSLEAQFPDPGHRDLRARRCRHRLRPDRAGRRARGVGPHAVHRGAAARRQQAGARLARRRVRRAPVRLAAAHQGGRALGRLHRRGRQHRVGHQQRGDGALPEDAAGKHRARRRAADAGRAAQAGARRAGRGARAGDLRARQRRQGGRRRGRPRDRQHRVVQQDDDRPAARPPAPAGHRLRHLPQRHPRPDHHRAHPRARGRQPHPRDRRRDQPTTSPRCAATTRRRSRSTSRRSWSRCPTRRRPAVEAERKARAEQALARVRNGEPFDQVAREMSEDSNKAKGGEMGSRPLDKYPDLFVNAVANVKVGGDDRRRAQRRRLPHPEGDRRAARTTA